MKEQIVKNIVWDFFISNFDNPSIEELPSNIDFIPYAKKIGAEFIKHNIPFEPYTPIQALTQNNLCPEVGAVKRDPDYYKNIPSPKFLENILSIEFQREILLMTLESNKKDFNYFISVLKRFKDIGVDCSLINNEFTNLIINSTKPNTKLGKDSYINLFLGAIDAGFYFEEEFLTKDFKQHYDIVFGGNTGASFHYFHCLNTENKIKSRYKELNNQIPSKEEVKTKKNKI